MPTSRTGSQLALALGDQETLSISDLYRRIDRALRGALPGDLWITGEVRSLSVSAKGICYIDLVDPVHGRDHSSPVVRVVCWARRWTTVRTRLDRLGIAVEAGTVVRVRGAIQLYAPRGEISFVLSDLDTDALVGKVAAERARLIHALVEEGLFDQNRRVSVPAVPLRIGLVASPGTEGHRDFVGCLEASGMAFAVSTVATQVQGRVAARSVASAIRRLQGSGCDLIVLVRGGGSKVDLAVFDAEVVARAIAGCPTAVWTGIGHTGDQSVADHVANRSFITPTECGRELAATVVGFWRGHLESGVRLRRLAGENLVRSERGLGHHRRRMIVGARSQLGRQSERLAHRTQALRGSAKVVVETHRHRLDTSGSRLARSARQWLAAEEAALVVRAERAATQPDRRLQAEAGRTTQWRRLLDAYDFQRQLDRGYSVTRRADGRLVRSTADLSVGAQLVTRLAEGSTVSEVVATADSEAPRGMPEPMVAGRDVGPGDPGSAADPEGRP